ncbi:unnamed protein product, partial [Musa banksii]
LLLLSQKLLSELLKKLDSELKHEVCHWAAYFVRWPWVGVVQVRAIESHDDNWWSE